MWIIQSVAQEEPQWPWVPLSSWVHLLLPRPPSLRGPTVLKQIDLERGIHDSFSQGRSESHWVKPRVGYFSNKDIIKDNERVISAFQPIGKSFWLYF